MIKGLIIGDNMSNLNFASGDQISASSSSRNELSITNSNISNLFLPQHSSASTTTQSAPPPPPKKKRSLPGNPDPEAEVVALSPKTLLATNRFICEVCNKGFQRDQNLQLHRRGHNLPWKLKQRANKEVIRKKVYVCPEATCVHHEPARALGDLTGIKKHFFRKHGEKKWKCDKCSKRYAVQSDWKAHSKICGTREYRCDCGTLFSRRDSFITHRAFCDALAQDTNTTTTHNNLTARALTTLNNNINNNSNINNTNPLLFPSSSSASQQQLVLQSQLDHRQLYGLNSLPVKREQHDAAVPPWLMSQPPLQFSGNNINNPSGTSTTTLDHSFIQGLATKPNPISSTVTLNPIQQQQLQQPSSAFASATALLQRAAQMGATISTNNNPRSLSSSSSSPLPFLGTTSIGIMPNSAAAQMMLMNDIPDNPLNAANYEMMNSSFGDGTGNNNNFLDHTTPVVNPNPSSRVGGGGGNNDGLTRDFLGLRTFPRREFFNMVGIDQHHLNSSLAYGDHHQKNHDHHHQSSAPWQG